MVELWVNKAGRVVVRAFNECHNNYTDVDLDDLLLWLRSASCRSPSITSQVSILLVKPLSKGGTTSL